jgi:hypothetical protein
VPRERVLQSGKDHVPRTLPQLDPKHQKRTPGADPAGLRDRAVEETDGCSEEEVVEIFGQLCAVPKPDKPRVP